MLTIRKEQMDVFEKVVLGQFQQDVVTYLAGRFPQSFGIWSVADQFSFVAASTQRAILNGLNSERGLAGFAEASVQLGIDFDSSTSKWTDILQDQELGSPAERLDYILEQLNTLGKD